MEFLTVLQGLDLAGILQSVVSGVFGEQIFEVLPEFGVYNLAQGGGSRVYNTNAPEPFDGSTRGSPPPAPPPPWTPPVGNFRDGVFTAALVRPRAPFQSHGGQGGGGGSSQPYGNNSYNATALGGSGTGPVDWDNLASVQRFRALAGEGLTAAQSNLSSITPEKDRRLETRAKESSFDNFDLVNPYFSQGLGPATYDSDATDDETNYYQSDKAKDEVRWFEASQRKFALREQELKGIANAPATEEFGAGTQGAYDAQQAGRAAAGVPFAQGARSAELLRQGQGPRVGGGAAQGGAGRQANRARAAEGRRFASNDRTTGSGGGGGGSTATRRLRAANLLRQPLGAGSQSAAQLLG